MMKYRVFLCCIFLSSMMLNAVITFDNQGLPTGSWRQTCKNATYDATTKKLVADCRTSHLLNTNDPKSAVYTKSSLVLDDLSSIEDIQNHNGWLIALIEQDEKYKLPAGDYQKKCNNCELIKTDDAAGNAVYCVRCECPSQDKDSKSSSAKQSRMVCHPDLLTLKEPVVIKDDELALNEKYLPAGNYTTTCKTCRIDIGYHKADYQGENGLQLACECPSSKGKKYKTHVRIENVKEFLAEKPTFSNTHGILTKNKDT